MADMVERVGNSLTLVHWSARPIRRALHAKRQENWHKPMGLWVSSEGNDDGWREWCQGEGFNLDRFGFRNEIRLKPDANILVIETSIGIYEFTEQWSVKDGGERFFRWIDWDAVAKRYSGIIIAPYQWNCRLDDRTSWYYSWDCASGCIWDAGTVAEIISERAEPFKEAA